MARKNGTTESFIEKAKAVHGERYDYSLVEYECSSAKVKILCPDHGIFEQHAGQHLQGKGCPSCPSCAVRNRAHKTDTFVEKAKGIHGEKYSYDSVEYKNSRTKVKIFCSKHGAFKQKPSHHLKGSGCPKCSSVYRPTTNEFIEACKAVHGGRYDYSLVHYDHARIKIAVLCPEHGVFEQRASDHLQGDGCPSCSVTGFNPEKPGSVYLLVTPGSVKVGITNKPVQKRLTNINSTTECKFNIERVWSFADGSVAPKVERVVLAMLRAKYKNPAKKFDGYTETFVTTDVSFVASTIDAVVSSINK